ncbi:MAG: hypothetical protein QNJ46_34620 [Leptolyngbyaceae cyanobacterium MO_188.B28]|nr:hypothetical protein [Leptolyngbyaceae cyanobacterium MO_188.B28]
MGTHNKEKSKFMDNVTIQESLLKYKELVYEYCALAVKCTLTDEAADRMVEILQKAESEPLLSFLIDEADHLVAHELGLIDGQLINQQQAKLQQRIETNWIDQLLLDIQLHPRKLQQFLKEQGLYKGAIDGVCGPVMEHATAVYVQSCG